MTIEELKALFETGKDITQELFETLIDELHGADGVNGSDGVDGEDGKSAYEVAVGDGFEGTVQEWLESLKGNKGDTGAPGQDGAVSQEDYDALLGRVKDLEDALDALDS